MVSIDCCIVMLGRGVNQIPLTVPQMTEPMLGGNFWVIDVDFILFFIYIILIFHIFKQINL